MGEEFSAKDEQCQQRQGDGQRQRSGRTKGAWKGGGRGLGIYEVTECRAKTFVLYSVEHKRTLNVVEQDNLSEILYRKD